MTQAHIGTLHFEERREAAKKRLQKLKAEGYLKARPRNICEPGMLQISRKGLAALETKGILREYPPLSIDALARRAEAKERTISHDLAVMDAKVAFHKALRTNGKHSLTEFSTWPLLYQFQATPYGFEQREQTVKPDGFIRILETDAESPGHSFFLEIDLSTEDHETLVRKAACYLDYYRSGGFAEWDGGDRYHFKKHPFRVLIVMETIERRNTLAERLANHTPPILTQVCISTMEDLQNDPLGSIWIRPVDFAKAVKGTQFEGTRGPKFGQGHQVSRDRFVERTLKKIVLFRLEK